MRRRLRALGAVALLAAATPVAAAQDAVMAYQRAIAHVCEKKVTPEMVRLYQEALKEMEAARAGYGRDSNFFGLRDPERAYLDCWQGTGAVQR
jgi:hypothetical protein